MSAPPVSPWATKPGAWALDAEEHEEELNQQRKAMEQSKVAAEAVVVPEAEFPSLKAAVATKGKKKKGKTLSLAEFTSSSVVKGVGLSHEELVNLPTGPRERSSEEMDRSRIGGAFRSNGDGDRWGRERGADEVRRPRGESREPLGPSRADEVDDWGAGKKSLMSDGGGGLGFERRGRSGGGFFGLDSKADEVDSWVSAKKSFAPVESGRRYGLRSYDIGLNGGGADSDTWGKKREERFVNGSENGSGGSGRPKLNLKPRTVPLSSSESRPQSPDVVVVKKSSNPFGEARPREDVLAEKGQDWKKLDEQFDSLRIKERPGSGDSRPGSAKRGFGSSRGNAVEDKTERTWRKTESVEGSRPSSAGNPTEKIEDTKEK